MAHHQKVSAAAALPAPKALGKMRSLAASIPATDTVAHMKEVRAKSQKVRKHPATNIQKKKKARTWCMNKSHEEMVTEAIQYCSPSPRVPAGPPCKLLRMTQRNTVIFQLKAASPRKHTIGQITDKQCGGEQCAERAAKVLKELWDLGASERDLQAVKRSGALGVTCGRRLKD